MGDCGPCTMAADTGLPTLSGVPGSLNSEQKPLRVYPYEASNGALGFHYMILFPAIHLLPLSLEWLNRAIKCRCHGEEWPMPVCNKLCSSATNGPYGKSVALLQQAQQFQHSCDHQKSAATFSLIGKHGGLFQIALVPWFYCRETVSALVLKGSLSSVLTPADCAIQRMGM